MSPTWTRRRRSSKARGVQASDVNIQRAQYEHAIAVLLGKPPAEFTLAQMPLDTRPPAIPVGLPSELLERRPDIAAAERRVNEANERIGSRVLLTSQRWTSPPR